MKTIIVSVWDRCTQAYMKPAFALTEGQAVRSFTDEVQRVGGEMNIHPEDYQLFKVGEWTDHKGEIVGVTPQCLAKAHEVIGLLEQAGDFNREVE